MIYKVPSRILMLLIVVGLSPAAIADSPRFLDQADDEASLPSEGAHALFWRGDEQIAGFRNTDRLGPTRPIPAGGDAYPLPAVPMDLGKTAVRVGERSMTVDEYIRRRDVAGLIVVRDGKVLFERYGLGNDEDSRWVSFSVSKSVVSMLFGAAVHDGYIKSVDEKVTDYLPRLKDSSYQDASIRNLLQMASGVQWDEDYADPDSDVARANYSTLSLYEHLRDKPRVADPGEKFNYNTAETNLAGTLLRSAVGNNLSTYLSEKIWRPFGMESDASWRLTEPGGGEFGGCCISATLRDYARIGLFAMNDGVLPDGTRVVPEGWMKESITPSKGYEGYGYFWWLNPSGTFEAKGVFGQGIYINPEERVVIAIHSAWPEAVGREHSRWRAALYSALVNATRPE